MRCGDVRAYFYRVRRLRYMIDSMILESPLSTADAMRDIQILLKNCRNGHVQISFQTRIFLQN